MTLDVRQLTPAIGAEISGIDLSSPGNADASAVDDALMVVRRPSSPSHRRGGNR